APKNEIGIRYRGLRATQTVTGRPRDSGSAHRSDAHETISRDVGNRPAASAHGVDIEGWKAHGKACNAATEGHLRLAIEHETHVGRGAAHVKRDETTMACVQASSYRTHDPSRRTRERGPNWHLGCARKRHEPTGRLTNAYGRVRCVRGDRNFQVREIAAHHRLQKGIEHGRGEA